MVEKNHNKSGKWTVTPIEVMTGKLTRLRRESFWIRQLHTCSYNGLNNIVQSEQDNTLPYVPAM
jgi:hypothetical protein